MPWCLGWAGQGTTIRVGYSQLRLTHKSQSLLTLCWLGTFSAHNMSVLPIPAHKTPHTSLCLVLPWSFLSLIELGPSMVAMCWAVPPALGNLWVQTSPILAAISTLCWLPNQNKNKSQILISVCLHWILILTVSEVSEVSEGESVVKKRHY